MGLSPPRWWCELKGGPAERRRQVENQGKTRRAGWHEKGKKGKEAGGVFHRQVFLVYRQQDRSELLRLQKMDLHITSNVELRLRFEKQSNDAKARGLS